MARSVWTGTISFGLVNVPVKAYTAVRDHDAHFHQLEKGSGARIRYRKVSEDSGKEVDGDDIEMGFEVRSGRYVTFSKEELDALRPESTKTIEVTDFVDLHAVDPIYYDKTYWLGPADDAGAAAYQLLLAAMEDQERVAVGTVVMRDKQHLAAIRPLDGALALSTMRFADEVVDRADVEGVPTRRTKPKPKQLELATQIIDSLAAEWDPTQYEDTYTEELRKRITAKDKGGEVVVDEGAAAPTSNVVDLMEALERSVQESKRGTRSSARSSGTKAKPKAKAKAKKATKAKRATTPTTSSSSSRSKARKSA